VIRLAIISSRRIPRVPRANVAFARSPSAALVGDIQVPSYSEVLVLVSISPLSPPLGHDAIARILHADDNAAAATVVPMH
jgi:hypothetical protein